MVSRAERGPVARLVAHRRPLAARLVRRADGDRPGDGAGGEPGGRRAAEPLDLPFRQSAGVDAGSDGGADDRDVVSVAAACAPRGAAPFAVSLALIILALLFGAEVKGARRWIFGLQPSEFIKPAFVVLAAWAFTEGGRNGPTAILAKLLAFLMLPLDHRAADPGAGLRPDDAGLDRLGGALLPRRPALVLGGRRRRHGHARRVRRVQAVAARA